MSSNSKVQWKRNDPTALSIPKRTPFKVLNKPDDNQLSDRTTTCLNIIPPPLISFVVFLKRPPNWPKTSRNQN